MEKKDNTRRRFFGLAVGAGLMTAFGLSKVTAKNRTTHFIGPDGKLYEVDQSKVKKVGMCTPGSKKSLKNW
ncbi:MAG: hypothetical protein DRI69_12075, partial [Bacteroidetes bacterium]